MSTIYNLDLFVSDRHTSCQEEIYERTVELLKKSGLIGIKKVNHYGLVEEGYDKTCKTFRRGLLDIFCSNESQETMPEILERLEKRLPLLSGEEYLKANELVSLGKSMLQFVSKQDPSSSILPWGIYRNLPICRSLEINTPAGRQSVHYHTEDNINCGVIQLYKPRKEKDWYDWDALKNFLFDASLMRTLSLVDDINADKNFLQRWKARRESKLLKRASQLSLEIIANPDCIDMIPEFIKKMSPISLE